MMDIKTLKLVAWVGEHEFGDTLGMKQVIVPGVGRLPLVARDDKAWVLEPEFRAAMQAQANIYGKPIYLARFTIEEIIETMTPRHQQQ